MEVDSSSRVHNASAEGAVVGCRLVSRGLVNCVNCLSDSQKEFIAALPAEDRTVAKDIYDAIVGGGAAGLCPFEIRVKHLHSTLIIILTFL